MVGCSRMDCHGHVICPNIRIGGRSSFPLDCAMAPASNTKKANAQLTSELTKDYAAIEHCVVVGEK